MTHQNGKFKPGYGGMKFGDNFWQGAKPDPKSIVDRLAARTKPLVNGDILTLAGSCKLIVKQRISLTNVIHGMYVRHGIKLTKNRLFSPKFLASLDLGELTSVN